jgi:FG-GAP-like repeat
MLSGGFVSRPWCCPLLVFSFLAFNKPAAAESFKSARFLPVPAGVDYVLSADLNGDGKLDLIYVASPGPNPRSPQVLLGNGDGAFAPAQSVQLPGGNFGTFGKFAIADVNKDGKLDLIVIASNGFSSSIAVLLGNGDGTFQPGIVSAGPTSNSLFPVLEPQMGIADFNEDGAVDIVMADAQNDTLSLLLGDNQGHFTLKNSWPAFNNPHEIYVADLNGDRHMDFVTHGFLAANATVTLGNGDGTFKPAVSYTDPHNVESIVLKDMNHDGHLDMVVSGFNDTVDVLLGKRRRHVLQHLRRRFHLRGTDSQRRSCGRFQRRRDPRHRRRFAQWHWHSPRAG